MSAHGAVVGGQRHMHLPIGLLAMFVAALIAGSISVVALQMAGPRTVTTSLSTDWGSQLAHPRVVDRSGETTVTEMPVQRLYPGGFGTAAAAAEMPVQRLYPNGFGAPVDETTTIRSGVRRKW